MRNSTKMGGSVKKKYQVGGKVKSIDRTITSDTFKNGVVRDTNMKMNPAKIQVGTTKPMTPAQKKAAMDKFKNMSPKKQMGGMIPAKPIATAPIQGTTGRRGAAGSNMAKGGSLKMVNPGANPGLAKLPAPVRNKMGYMKKGGTGPGKGLIDQVKNISKAIAKTPAKTSKLEDLQNINDATVGKFSPKTFANVVAMNGVTNSKNIENAARAVAKKSEHEAKFKRAAHPSDVLGQKPKYLKKAGGQAHPGFKAVQAKIAAKSGVSKKAAGAILAASTRKASAKAKAANPRLKRVKG